MSFVSAVDAEFLEFLKAEGITAIRIHVDRSFEVLTLKQSDVIQFLEALQLARLPLLVHCYDGATTTGLAVACLRKMQQHSLSYIIAEYCRFTRDYAMQSDEKKFLDRFRPASLTLAWLPGVSGATLAGATPLPAPSATGRASPGLLPSGPPTPATRARERSAQSATLDALALAGSDRRP